MILPSMMSCEAPDVDIIARTPAQIFHEQAGFVVAVIELEARLLQSGVVGGIELPHLVIERLLELIHDAVGQGGEDEVRLGRRDAAAHCALRIEIAQADFHQRRGAHDMRARPLHHGHVDAGFVQRGANVMG